MAAATADALDDLADTDITSNPALSPAGLGIVSNTQLSSTTTSAAAAASQAVCKDIACVAGNPACKDTIAGIAAADPATAAAGNGQGPCKDTALLAANPTCKDTIAAAGPAVAAAAGGGQAPCKDTAWVANPACKDTGAAASSALQPVPSIGNVRQALASAFQLLDAAAAEPQWLRGRARRFEVAAWDKVIKASQLLALRWV